jgi:hypothetical protein
MPRASRPIVAAVAAAVLLAAASPGDAQAPAGPRMSRWAFGAAGELLLREDIPYRDDVDEGFTASLERRIIRLGPQERDVLGIRVQVGRGPGDWRADGLSYTRLLAGVIRHACVGKDECYGKEGRLVYLFAGGGVYRLPSPGAAAPSAPRTRPSVFGGLGMDRKLGTGRTTLRMEFGGASIGTELHAAISMGLQVHIW